MLSYPEEQPSKKQHPVSQPFQMSECQCCKDRLRELGEPPMMKIALPEKTSKTGATVLVCPSCDAIKI